MLNDLVKDKLGGIYLREDSYNGSKLVYDDCGIQCKEYYNVDLGGILIDRNLVLGDFSDIKKFIDIDIDDVFVLLYVYTLEVCGECRLVVFKFMTSFKAVKYMYNTVANKLGYLGTDLNIYANKDTLSSEGSSLGLVVSDEMLEQLLGKDGFKGINEYLREVRYPSLFYELSEGLMYLEGV